MTIIDNRKSHSLFTGVKMRTTRRDLEMYNMSSEMHNHCVRDWSNLRFVVILVKCQVRKHWNIYVHEIITLIRCSCGKTKLSSNYQYFICLGLLIRKIRRKLTVSKSCITPQTIYKKSPRYNISWQTCKIWTKIYSQRKRKGKKSFRNLSRTDSGDEICGAWFHTNISEDLNHYHFLPFVRCSGGKNWAFEFSSGTD